MKKLIFCIFSQGSFSKVICLPSGDQHGHPSSSLVNLRLSLPSSFITQIPLEENTILAWATLTTINKKIRQQRTECINMCKAMDVYVCFISCSLWLTSCLMSQHHIRFSFLPTVLAISPVEIRATHLLPNPGLCPILDHVSTA